MSEEKPKAIHFGAGNIGRGLIAPLLAQSGYHVTFADVDQVLIDNINNKHHYDVHILDRHEEQFAVDDISAVLSTTGDVVKQIADPKVQIITTAVGVNILDKIAGTLANGLRARRVAGGKTLNVIACENAIGATSRLHKSVESHLSSPEDHAYLLEYIGFANCSVDRIIPPFEPDSLSHTLDVGVEGFFEWIVESTSLKGSPLPDIHGWVLTDHLPSYNERKLFTLNTGHAIAAYLGSLKGLRTIDESIAHPEIHTVVRGALEESGAALVKKHGFKKEDHEKYIDKIEERLRNKAVTDEVARVARQPLRKLGKEDRLVGPTRMAKEQGVEVKYLPVGIAAALRYNDDSDEQSRELQKKIKDNGVEKVIADITGFDHDTGEHKKIVDAYHSLEKF